MAPHHLDDRGREASRLAAALASDGRFDLASLSRTLNHRIRKS
jgi:hypothetical protein